jgi:low temperature requirement protein LtrA
VTTEPDAPVPAAPGDGSHHEPPVAFLELFYDLVFVAATMVISNRFSSDLSWRSAATCASVFGLLWVFWFHTTLLMNVERRDDLGHRALVLLQMFGITLTVLAFADKASTNNDLLGIAFALVMLVIVAMYQRAGRDRPDIRQWAVQRRNLLLLAAVLVTLTTWLPGGLDDVVFLLAMALLLVPSRGVLRPKLAPPPVDLSHLTERAALLTLIMMGEAFVKVALVVSAGTIERDDVAAMVVEFVAVFALWLVYFDDIPKAGIRRGRTEAELWTLAHLPMQLGIVAVAVGISKFLQVGDHGVHDEVVLILGFGFVGVYGGLALIGVLSDRHPIRSLTVARLVMVAASVVLCAITWTFAWFTPFQLLVALAACELAHAYVADRLRRSTFVGPRPAMA